jgi:polyisoprenoid-binding protein YceI
LSINHHGKEETMSTETIDQQQIPAGTWAVDPVHSSVNFAITHNGVTTFRSGFERYEAHLSGGEQPRLEGSVDVASIAIDEEMLKGHLLSPEFFDTQRYPQLRFASSEVSVGEDGSLRVVGDLEIHGETRKVEASGRFAHLGEDAYGKARVGLSIEATVDRRDFGLDWQAQLPSGGDVLDYAVTISVDLELVAEEA